MPTSQILLIEDDAELSKMVAEFLSQHEFAVNVESRGDQAVDRIVAENPDAVILDVNLPGYNGFDVCRTVRPKYDGPILILTARGDEVDEVIGLEFGADDYMAKPVKPRVLLARLRAHLRKPKPVVDTPETPSKITIGDMMIDASRRLLEIDGNEISLTTAEFDLVWLLAQSAGQDVSRDTIYRELFGTPYDGLDRSIDLRVSRIRRKLGDDSTSPTRIKSVRGVGYILVPDK